MKKVRIVCDGSSLGNGRGETRAAAAAVLEYGGRRKIIGTYLGNATNQQAEIVAACVALEALTEPCRVELISDSQYVISTMKGLFKRKANLELWQRLDRAAQQHKIEWTWTRGHAGHEVQEMCDEAARLIAETGEVDAEALRRILQGSE
ncbi:MAG TPA: RNase H family protein [Blastocatellia bacterium]|nr:RNase H family protein [Blastocatellia bacterium]